ncbi:MAG: YggS family pyridoxal phosphate-dependent enzyme, partial [Nitrospirae bacterium]|nr:YggS family pyridoxal phosphate-dependent enzyme [Nitrospirota bacterium]
AERSGRDVKDIKLIAVTKTIDVNRIKEAVDAGLRIFGENRVQEAQKKITSCELRVTSGKIEWHFIGHLQTNKAKYVVQLFDMIHSIDSTALAEEINKQAAKINKIQDALIEVKLSEEETKHGVPENELMKLLESTRDIKNLNILGLMTIPPFFEDAEKTRPYFKRLRELRNEAVKNGFNLPELSMGMSHDFEIAIEEGATMVRIGTAIFGERK